MHFLVIGATGAIGKMFCSKALAKGHRLTIFARNPAKLPADLENNASVQIIKGELDDRAALERASESRADAFISCAGPLGGNVKGTPLTDGLKVLLPLLSSHGIKRALILCTPSYPSDSDMPSLLWRFGRFHMRTFRFSEYSEMLGVGSLVGSQPVKDLQWTLFRVGQLLDGPEVPVETTFLGSSTAGISINREGVASWVLNEALENKWIGEVPYICNKGKN